MAKKRRTKKSRARVSARRRAETHKTGFERTTVNVASDVQFFKLTEAGTKRIDVIPYKVSEGSYAVRQGWADPGDSHYESTFFSHRRIGPNQEDYVCPAKTFGKKCPICEDLQKKQQDPSADEELIKALRPKERQLWNVVDLAEPEKGVQIWDMSFHLFGKLLDAEIRNADDDEDFEFFADPEDGQTLKLGVAKDSVGTNSFHKVETIGFKKRRESIGEDVLSKAHKLDEILKVLPYDELRTAYLQIEDDDEPEPSKSKPVEDDDDEDEDDSGPDGSDATDEEEDDISSQGQEEEPDDDDEPAGDDDDDNWDGDFDD